MKKVLSGTTIALVLFVGLISISGSTAARPTAPGDELLQLLPDGNAVAMIDVQRALNSPLWASLSAQEKVKSALEKVQSGALDLGVKLSDLQSVALSFQFPNANDPAVAITGGFDQSSLIARLRSNAKLKVTSEKYKEYEVYKVESIPEPAGAAKTTATTTDVALTAKMHGSDATSFVFFDAKTAVVGTPSSVRSSVDVRTGSKQSAAQNTRLVEGLSQNPTAAVRFSIILTSSITKGLESSEFPFPDLAGLRQVFGSIDVTSGIDLVATLRNDTAEQAKTLAERLNAVLSMIKGFFPGNDAKGASIAEALKSFSIVGADRDVKITGTVPAELIQLMLK